MRADKIEKRYEIFWQLLRSECPDLAAHLSGSLSLLLLCADAPAHFLAFCVPAGGIAQVSGVAH
jgi:hypothetical protein